MKLNGWLETGLDGDVLLTPCVPKGITGYDDDDDNLAADNLALLIVQHLRSIVPQSVTSGTYTDCLTLGYLDITEPIEL